MDENMYGNVRNERRRVLYLGKLSVSGGRARGATGGTQNLERQGTFLNQSQYRYGHSFSTSQTGLDVSKQWPW